MELLRRLKAPPDPELLTPAQAQALAREFDPHAAEVLLSGMPVPWAALHTVEIAKAPSFNGATGFLVGLFVNTDDRYHVGLYYDNEEKVLPNVPLKVATYVVQAVAYYSPGPVRYRGPEGLAPVEA